MTSCELTRTLLSYVIQVKLDERYVIQVQLDDYGAQVIVETHHLSLSLSLSPTSQVLAGGSDPVQGCEPAIG